MRLAGPWEHGTPGTEQQGTRTDLIKLREAIKSGKRKRELVEDDALCEVVAKYPRFASLCYEAFAPETREAPTVVLLYGPPGCGKTKHAYTESPHLWKAPIGKGGWYDQYDGHSAVLFDDFAGKASHTALSDLLRILDRYSEKVPVKGGFVSWRPTTIYITTNIHPFEWYDWQGREVHYPALRRRIAMVVAWRSDGTGRRELAPQDPLTERFWTSYSLAGVSAPPVRDYDPTTQQWVVRAQSTPGDWKRKFDFLFD